MSTGFVVALDRDGGYRWDRLLETPDGVWPLAIDSGPEGELAVSGRFTRRADFGGGERVSAGLLDAFVAMYDARGAHLWARSYGGGSPRDVWDNDWGYGVSIGPDGNAYAAGRINGSYDFGGSSYEASGSTDAFVASFDGLGEWRHDYVIADGSWNQFLDSATSAEGVSVASGSFRGADPLSSPPARGGEDGPHGLLVAFGPDGSPIAHRVWRSSDSAYGHDVAVRGCSVAVVGSFRGTTTFSSGPRTAPRGKEHGYLLTFDL